MFALIVSLVVCAGWRSWNLPGMLFFSLFDAEIRNDKFKPNVVIIWFEEYGIFGLISQ